MTASRLGIKIDKQCNICCFVFLFRWKKFISYLEESGLILSEPPRFHPHRPWHLDRPEKPWEAVE